MSDLTKLDNLREKKFSLQKEQNRYENFLKVHQYYNFLWRFWTLNPLFRLIIPLGVAISLTFVFDYHNIHTLALLTFSQWVLPIAFSTPGVLMAWWGIEGLYRYTDDSAFEADDGTVFSGTLEGHYRFEEYLRTGHRKAETEGQEFRRLKRTAKMRLRELAFLSKLESDPDFRTKLVQDMQDEKERKMMKKAIKV